MKEQPRDQVKELPSAVSFDRVIVDSKGLVKHKIAEESCCMEDGWCGWKSLQKTSFTVVDVVPMVIVDDADS